MKTRFAPSPTGNIHFGSARTALFNFLIAKACQGQFILRIDDTDVKRSQAHFTANILESLQWLGLSFDTLIFQSQRRSLYQHYLEILLAQGSAYICTCSKERLTKLKATNILHKHPLVYDGLCREQYHRPEGSYVIRFKAQQQLKVSWEDQLRGKMVCDSTGIDDFIIYTSAGCFTYNFCSAIDDIECGISHVVRGEDHITNTYKQVSIYHALKQTLPLYTHLPLLLHQSGCKLSKRASALNILALRAQGYLPAALINFLVRMGWSYKDQEIFTLADLIQLFPTGKINKAPARIDPAKLKWLNKEHLHRLNFWTLHTLLQEYAHDSRQNITYLVLHPYYQEILMHYRYRSETLAQIIHNTHFLASPYQPLREQPTNLAFILPELLAESWDNSQQLKQWLKYRCSTHQLVFKEIVQSIYVYFTGLTEGPDVALLLKWLGKEVVARAFHLSLAASSHHHL